jgi:hypothetical protein
LNRVKRFAGGDEKRFAIWAAEADIGRPFFRHINVASQFSRRIKNRNAIRLARGAQI